MSNPIVEPSQFYNSAPIYDIADDEQSEEMVVDSPRLILMCENTELPDDGFTLSVPVERK